MAVLPGGIRIRLLVGINDSEPTELASVDLQGKARSTPEGVELSFPPFRRVIRRLLLGATWRSFLTRWRS